MRDIIVYKCDVCDREVQLQRKPKTIETVGRCIITANCRGKLYVEKLIKTTSPFLKRTEEVVGLDNFFQKQKLFKFTQRYEKTTWYINHNLETFPIISVYDDDKNIIPDSNFTTDIVDKNTIKLVFTVLQSGTAELYVREIAKTAAVVETSDVLETTPVSTNLLTGTMAILTREKRTVAVPITLNNDGVTPVLDTEGNPTFTKDPDNVRLKMTSTSGQVLFSSAEVTATNTNSPWNGNTKVIIRNRAYYVGFIDFFTQGFNTSLISSGTTITIDDSERGLSHFLLTNSPFDPADIIKDYVMEASKVNSSTGSLFFDNDEVFCDNRFRTKIYPNLIIS